MGQWAIMVTYHGSEPSKEALRGAIEQMMRMGTYMQAQTITPIVLNENEIAAALIAHITPKYNIEVESGFDDLCTKVCNIIKEDTRVESVTNKYVLSRICCIDNAFSKDVDALYKTGIKLQVVKRVKEQCNIGLKEAKDIVDALYDIVQKCQGRIVE